MCVHICSCILMLLNKIAALSVDILRSNVGFERGQAGWRVYEEITEEGGKEEKV